MALIDALKAVDPILEIKVRADQGFAPRTRQGLQTGDLDMGLVGGEVMHEWLSAHRNAPPLKIVSAVHSAPGMFCVRADSSLSQHRRSQGPAGRLGAARLAAALCRPAT